MASTSGSLVELLLNNQQLIAERGSGVLKDPTTALAVNLDRIEMMSDGHSFIQYGIARHAEQGISEVG
jgi:hypothetical protein